MAKAGLSFENPLYEASGGTPAGFANPYTGLNPAVSSGSDALQRGLADLSMMGAAGRAQLQTQFSMPAMRGPERAPEPEVLYSAASRKLFVNGVEVDEDDDAGLLRASQLLDRPSVGRPQGGDWVPIPTEMYRNIVQEIAQPGIGRLMSKNFGRGIDQLQMLAGRGLQLAGAEQLGAGIVAKQEEELARTAPYERQFTDIESGRGAVEWFLANLAQQGPNLLESVALGLAGAAAGTAAAGPVGTAIGGLAGAFGKKAFKDKVLDAAKKVASGQAKPGSTEYALLRNTAAVAGATAANFSGNIATGAADIYGEMREQGVGPEDFGARLTALAGSLPYAGLETLGEYFIASRLLGGTGRAALPATATMRQRGGELLRRGTAGFAVGAPLEGTTEALQEGLVMGLSGQDLTSNEAVNRFINSFAAGAAIGGPAGGIANLKSRNPDGTPAPEAKEEINLLGGDLVIPPGQGPTPGTAVEPYYTPVTPMGAIPSAPAQLAGPTGLALPAPPQPVTPMGGPVMMVTPEGVAYPEQMLRQQGNVPPGAPGTQGVLDIFGGAIPAQELAARMQSQAAPLALPAPVAAPAVSPQQGALQFAPPAPPAGPANLQMANQLRVVQDRLRRQREFEAAQAQQQVEMQQQIDMLAQQSQNARDLYTMQLAQQQAAAQPPMPTRVAGPVAPRQLELFNRREAPRPSRAEALRRGAPGAQPAPVTGTTPMTPAERRAQLSLFTQEGKPSVAALKAAGVRGKVPPPKLEAGAVQAPPTGRRVTPATVAKAKAEQAAKAAPTRGLKKQAGIAKEEKPSAAQEGKLKQGRVAERKQNNARVEARRDVGQKPKAEVQAGRAEAGGGGVALKRGAQPQKVISLEEGRENLERQEDTRDVRLYRAARSTRINALRSEYAAQIEKVERLIREQRKELFTAKLPAQRNDIFAELQSFVDQYQRIIQSDFDTLYDTYKTEMYPAALMRLRDDYDISAFEARVKQDLPNALELATTSLKELKALPKGEVLITKKPEAAPAAAPTEPAKAPVEVEQTSAEVLAEEINVAETTTDIRTFRGAIETVINYAFFTSEETNTKKLVEQARAFLNNTQFTDAQMSAMDEAYLDAVQYETQLEAVYKGGSKKGQQKPWFSYAISRNLLPSIKARIINMPAEYKAQTNPVTGETATTKPVEPSAEKMSKTPEALLGVLINDLIFRVMEYSKLDKKVDFRGKTYANIVTLAKELYANTSAQGREYIVRNYKLKDYFTTDGSPKMLKSAGRYIITHREYTAEEQRQIEQAQREEARALAAEKAALRAAEFERARIEKEVFREEDAWDDADGMFYRDDGTPLKATIPAGRVRLLVNNFLAKLKVKPATFIYANVADLKKRNPDLYRRAAAARKEGDFDTTNAVGYSFGPNVIIFTDFVRTEQQLKFVLAHETLGHFGFKGVIPKKDLDAVLNRIYDLDPNVQAAVDAMVANRGMSKLEAVEEFLADNAAELDTSLIARMWNVLKNFLNKLGFEFQDDEARYFVNLARKYVRQGDAGNFVNVRTIVSRMQALTQDEADGRYARVYAGDMGSQLISIGAINRRYGGTGGLLGAAEAFAKNVFGMRQDMRRNVGRLLEQLQTLDNKARRSFGLSEIYKLLAKQQQKARALLSNYHQMTSFTHSATIFGFGEGVTEDQKERAGELLARAALLRSEQATDELIKSFEVDENGNKTPLVTVDSMGNVVVDEKVRQKIQAAGFVTAEEFRKGFDVTYTDGSKARFQYDVDEKSPEWRVYLELRNTVNEAAIDLMLANYEAAQSETTRVVSDLNIGRRGTNVFSADDLAAIRKAAAMYQAKRYAGSDIANAKTDVKKKAEDDSEAFVIAFGRALFRDDVYAAWMKDPNAKPDIVKDMSEFLAAEYDDIRAQLPSLRAKIKDDNESFQVQKAIRDLFFFDLQSKNADFYAKRTILGSYVPFTRRGEEEVRLVAVDKQGNPVSLDENIKGALPYFQFNTRREAMEAAKELEKEFGADNEFVLLNKAGQEITVRLKVEVSRVRQTSDFTDTVNFNEFVYVLNRLNINLAPDVRERIITTLTNQNDRARKNLNRSGNEGWDKDVVRSVSEHLETSAHVAAKKLYRHRLDDILLNDSNWRGDDQKLADLKDAVDNAQTDGERARAQRAYDEYAYMYRYMKGASGENTVTIDGKEVPTLGVGEDYRREAHELLQWYSDTTNITDSTEDMLSGETGSALKLLTVLMQLGGSVATAVVNLASLPTNSLPYLSYYNPKQNVGGGYGLSKASTALWKAASDTKNANFAEASFLKEILDKQTFKQYNLTQDEAQFLLDQTEQGTLQASQSNALVGTARGKIFNNRMQAAVRVWMSMFSYTEQFNRRVTALAAYRLEKDRLRAQGVTDEQQLIAGATEAADKAITKAQGEYAMFNRPKMARGGLLQYIFMYKQFVIITVELMRGLPPKGQMLMLGLLLLTSGLKGLPFAEDIFDIVDTIAQKLGLKTASVEKELAEWIDSVAPGMTPYLMRGVLDRVSGATMSTRLGMGDLVPLTGAFKAGADPAREVADFAGPVFGGIAGLVGMAGSFTKYGAETIGLRDDVTTISGIMRDSPIAAMRAIADGAAYLDDGMITNNRGQVVTREAPYHVIVARMLGFYPAIATEQNDIVRLSKSVASYAKAIKADYVSAYVKAKLDNDTARMQQLVADVRAWNADAEGTGLEITNFVRSAQRAALEASRPTVMRYLKSAPKEIRPETLELLRLNGLEEDVR